MSDDCLGTDEASVVFEILLCQRLKLEASRVVGLSWENKYCGDKLSLTPCAVSRYIINCLFYIKMNRSCVFVRKSNTDRWISSVVALPEVDVSPSVS